MNLLQAFWPFGGTDASTDAETSRSLSVKPVIDAVSGGIGVRPMVELPILVEPFAPSRLLRRPDETDASSVTSPGQHRGPPRWRFADQDAHELLSALIEWGYGGQAIEYARVVELYRVLCDRLNRRINPWNPVARELRRLTGGRKTYRWYRLESGQPHRLRVYEIPPKIPAKTGPVRLASRSLPEERSAA